MKLLISIILSYFIVVGMLLFLVLGAKASDSDGKYYSAGVGTDKCSKLTMSFHSGVNIETYIQWLAGFITLANQEAVDSKNVLGGDTSIKVFFEAMDRLCKKEPSLSVSGAALKLIRVLKEEPSKPVIEYR